jgi:hypothetical protein
MSRNGTWQWIVDTESSTIIFQKACQPCLKASASRSVQCNLLLFQVSTPGWSFPPSTQPTAAMPRNHVKNEACQGNQKGLKTNVTPTTQH